MKTLIDRTCSPYTEISNKEFYFIVTAADNSKRAMERTLEGFRAFTSCLSGPKGKGHYLWNWCLEYGRNQRETGDEGSL